MRGSKGEGRRAIGSKSLRGKMLLEIPLPSNCCILRRLRRVGSDSAPGVKDAEGHIIQGDVIALRVTVPRGHSLFKKYLLGGRGRKGEVGENLSRGRGRDGVERARRR